MKLNPKNSNQHNFKNPLKVEKTVFKLKPLLFLLLIGLAFISCSKDEGNGNGDNGGGTPPGQGQVVYDYTFTIEGGALDGQTFSNTFNAPEQSDGPLYADKDVPYNNEYFEADHIFLDVKDDKNEDNYVQIFSQILLDGDRNPLAISAEDDEFASQSYLGIVVSTDPENINDPNTFYSAIAQSGSISFSDLNIPEGETGPASFTMDFEGSFEQTNINYSDLVDVQISGTVKVSR